MVYCKKHTNGSVTMKNKITILVLVIAVAVNLSNGFSIKVPPGISGGFSSSSSSASAFSQASSSSYSFNGDLQPHAFEALKAGAGAVAGTGALAGANDFSLIGAATHAGADALADVASGAIAHAGSGLADISGQLAGSSAVANAAAGGSTNGNVESGFAPGCSGSKGCERSQDSNLNGGSTIPIDTESYKTINSDKYTTGYSSDSKSSNFAPPGQLAGSTTTRGSTNGNVKSGSEPGCSGSKGCEGSQDSNLNGGSTIPIDTESYKTINSDKYTTGYSSDSKSSNFAPPGQLAGSTTTRGSTNGNVESGSAPGCSGSKGCEGSQDSNLNGGSTIPIDTESYKTINSDKYTTGYSSDSKSSNFAPTGQLAGSKTTPGGCSSCKGPFPGPNGSIYDYKPASSVPKKGLTGAVTHITSGAGSGAYYHTSIPATDLEVPAFTSPPSTTGSLHHGAGSGGGHVSPSIIASFPGPSGSIYDSKPVSAAGAGAGVQSGATGEAHSNTGSYSSGGAVGVPSKLPGPTGSIYDSKPASSVPTHTGSATGAGASTNSGAYSGTSSISGIPSTHPVSGPACSYTPGSKNNNCGSSNGPTSGHGASAVIPILPGPSGSIYDSKPATSLPAKGTFSGAGAVAGAGASATASAANSGTGSVSNIPLSPIEVVPILPGPSGSIYDSTPVKGAGAGSGSATGAGASTNSGAYSGTSSISGIPSTHPVSGPACSYTPGSKNNNCGSSNGPTSGHGASAVIPILPGPSGSIYDSKPATSLPAKGTFSGAGSAAGAGISTNSGAYSGTSLVSGIPSSHPVVGPACTYTPGSKNKNCGSSTVGPSPGHSAYAIIPILPGPSGSIYDSKPATSIPVKGTTSGAGAVPGAGAYATTSAGANSGAGSVSNIPLSPPVIGPACSYTPGSTDKNCQGNSISSTSGPNVPGVVPILPGPSGSIYDSTPVKGAGSGSGSATGAGASTNSGAYSGTSSISGIPSGPGSGSVGGFASGSGSYSGTGSVSNLPSPSIQPPVGPACSYAPGSANKCGSISGDSKSTQTEIEGPNVPVPSIHPQLPSSSGSYYINKPALPSKDIHAPLPSFSQQIPCSGKTCGSGYSNQGAISSSTAFAGAHSATSGGSDNSKVIYEDNDQSDHYKDVSHDEAHKSGGIVYENDDGSYHIVPKTTTPTYKNAVNGGYAVSSDQAKNTGFVIGPGTGNLPIEGEHIPFGSGGAFGGSNAFVKKANHGDNKPFGTSGAFGGSAAFAKGSSISQSSENQLTGNNNGFATGDVTIQKVDGTLVAPLDDGSYRPGCSTGACSSGFGSSSGSGTGYSNGEAIINKESQGCSGASCDDTQVYIIESNPTETGNSFSSGCSSGSCGASGSGSNYDSSNGFATGEVLVQKGNGATYDVTNHGAGSNAIANSYSGANGGHHSGIKFGLSGCTTGLCGGSGLGAGGSFGFSSSGGILNKLFGAGGLSGSINKFGGHGFGGNGGYSNAGSYSTAGSGGYASAGASAHASSFASSF